MACSCHAGLDLSFSNFSGASLPADVRWLRGLRRLGLSGCGLNGTLPAAWSTLTNLTSMDLSRNALVSTLPPQW